MIKFNDSCAGCMGFEYCSDWMAKELKTKEFSCRGRYYANKEQVEGLLADWDYRRGKIKPKCKDDKMSEEQTKYDPKRGNMLNRAIDIINGARQNQYGAPEDSFATIAYYWNTYLDSIGIDIDDCSISGKDVSMMMALLKIARMSIQGYKQDNFVDAAGYLGIADDMAAQEDGK